MSGQESGSLAAITDLVRSMQRPGELRDVLQLVVDGASRAVGVPRASLRVLDPTRTRLVAACRTGEPLHLDPDVEFRVGEGLMGWIAEHGTPIRTGDAEADPRFAEREDRREPIGSFLGAPIVSGSLCLGVIGVVHPERDHFTSEHEQILTLIACMCGPLIEERRFSHVASVDPLTSAMTRRGMELLLPEARISDQGGLPVSIALADLDRFRDINQTYGNVVGDQVLREVAKILACTLGAGDALVRYGGETFMMILPGVGAQPAAALADQARRAIQSASLSFHAVSVKVTASFGVATRRPGESRADLIRRADEALIAAKKQGRNRVSLSD